MKPLVKSLFRQGIEDLDTPEDFEQVRPVADHPRPGKDRYGSRDFSVRDLGNRHLLVIDRELEIRSAPYEGTGIAFTPQGKGHIEFLKKAALSREYGSAITGYHKDHDTQAIALRNFDLSLKRRAYEEMVERERAPLLLVAESLNGNPQEATLVHIADMKGHTRNNRGYS